MSYQKPSKYGSAPGEKRYWNVSDIELWLDNLHHIEALLADIFAVDCTLYPILPVTSRTLGYASHFNEIERNLDEVISRSGFGGEYATKTWQGAEYDAEPMTWIDWNRWFDTLATIKEHMDNIQNNLVYCGVGRCGQARLWQARFRRRAL